MKSVLLIAFLFSSLQSLAVSRFNVEGEAAEKLWNYIGTGITQMQESGKSYWYQETKNVSCKILVNGRGKCTFDNKFWRYDAYETQHDVILDDSDSTRARSIFLILKDSGLTPNGNGIVHASSVKMFKTVSPLGGYGRKTFAVIVP